MELVDDFLTVRKAFGWLPAVVAFAIAFPSNQILELVTVCAAVQDFLNFVLQLAIDFHRFRWGWLFSIDVVALPWREAVTWMIGCRFAMDGGRERRYVRSPVRSTTS